ncbi:hypothetical protein CC80DRAFT_396787 [Byssothecium circinans]|uniref:Xylanolytic transcriptional activator regulatory domain-containing protein n=1 Tax=Byssothecium circinans TaxID=147558 RepID=A0A6A5UG07_9PLEO|nr:hypothetical protein CC80DRAFT_396787 [Byssothecium circinans]
MNLSSPAAIFARDRLLVPNPNEDSRERSRDATSRTSPEPPQTDLQGHYVGPASGVSFLLRIQKRLHQNTLHSHDSSIFTFGDAPLPEFDPTFFVLPPKADAQKLVGRYFDFAAPTHRFMHRPSVEQMLDEFYETQGNMRNKDDAPSKTALLLIVLAQAKAYSGLDTLPNDHSARYFFASERQLSKERGAVRLASVQARLGQCFYLLSQSRINHCWSLFGTMAHLAFAIGLNRGRGAPSANIDYVEVESRRRCFWIAYVLDKYLAAALGRPRTFKDEDIDQELPTVVHDSDLLPHSITPAPLSSYEIPLSMAPIEHIKISRIVSLVLKDLYAINPPPTHPQRLALAAHHTASLQQWRSNLTRFLDTTELPSSVLIPIYQRQRNVLNLAYYHAVILINRPFLLSNFANLTRKEGSKAAGPDTTTKENVQACLDAAMGIVRVIDDYSASGTQLVRAFWFTQYYAFCAVVVLYVYRIQQHIVDPGKCEGYFSAGQRCQAVLEGISETDCLSKRYCVVLEELRLEAARRTTTTTSTDPAESATMTSPSHAALTTSSHILAIPPLSSPQRDPSPASFSNLNAPYYGPAVAPSLPTPESALFNQNFAMSPNSIMADLTSWGQFDSLVTAGMGGMIDAGAGGLGINAGGTGDLGFTFG